MKQKKFTAVITLQNGQAVKSIVEKDIVLEQLPEDLAKYYSDNNADEIIVFDLSEDDAGHEKNISAIKRIAESCEVPVIGGGNVKRFEDIKKLLYAGCQKAVLNYGKEGNVEITKEVSERFGKDKIMASVPDAETIYKYRTVLNEFVSEILIFNEAEAKECIKAAELPVLVPMSDAPLDKMMETLKKEEVSGVYGKLVNANIAEINSLKSLCAEAGIKTNGFDCAIPWSELTVGADGLIPVVVQEYKTKEVLMVAYMNEQAYETTIKSGRMTYYSRSRKSQWVKGETSGHFQYLKSLSTDCDKDTLLAKVSQVGPACHTGSHSCFFREIVKRECIETDPLKVFEDVYNVILDRKINPKEGSYTNYLFDKGIDKILKKLGEESTEIVIAAKNPDPEEIKYEISDYLYHMMVLMAEKNVTWDEITRELARR